MTCQKAIDEFLIDYVEGKLSVRQRARFALHLAICAPCRRYVESYRKVIALGKSVAAADEPVSPSVPEELVQAILAAKAAED